MAAGDVQVADGDTFDAVPDLAGLPGDRAFAQHNELATYPRVGF